MFLPSTALLALLLPLPTSAAITLSNAESAFTTLQQWYNTTNGLWIPSTGWWNSANCLTVIADLAALDSTVKSQATNTIFPTTYSKAQAYNLQMQKAVTADYLPKAYYGGHGPQAFPQGWAKPAAVQTNGFLNGCVAVHPTYVRISGKCEGSDWC